MADRRPDFDPYELLGLDASADAATVDRAYKARIRHVHPDIAGIAGLDETKRLNIAREWLLDPDLRAQLPKPTPRWGRFRRRKDETTPGPASHRAPASHRGPRGGHRARTVHQAPDQHPAHLRLQASGRPTASHRPAHLAHRRALTPTGTGPVSPRRPRSPRGATTPRRMTRWPTTSGPGTMSCARSSRWSAHSRPTNVLA